MLNYTLVPGQAEHFYVACFDGYWPVIKAWCSLALLGRPLAALVLKGIVTVDGTSL